MSVKKNFTVYPIQNQRLWSLYKKQQSSFWRAEEVDLSGDMRDWEKLNENEQYFIKNIFLDTYTIVTDSNNILSRNNFI